MQERLPKDDNASNILNACNSKVHLYWQHSKVERGASESNPNMSRRKGPRYLGLHKPTRLRPAGLADSTHSTGQVRFVSSTPMATCDYKLLIIDDKNGYKWGTWMCKC